MAKISSFIKKTFRVAITPGTQIENLMEKRVGSENIQLRKKLYVKKDDVSSSVDGISEGVDRAGSTSASSYGKSPKELELEGLKKSITKLVAALVTLALVFLLLGMVAVKVNNPFFGLGGAKEPFDFSNLSAPDLKADLGFSEPERKVEECPVNLAVNREITSRYGVSYDLPYSSRGVDTEECLDETADGIYKFTDSYSGLVFDVEIENGMPMGDNLYYGLFNINGGWWSSDKDKEAKAGYHSLDGIRESASPMPSSTSSPSEVADKDFYQGVLTDPKYKGVPRGLEGLVAATVDSETVKIEVGGLPKDTILNYLDNSGTKDLDMSDSTDLLKYLDSPLTVSGGTETENQILANELKAKLGTEVKILD